MNNILLLKLIIVLNSFFVNIYFGMSIFLIIIINDVFNLKKDFKNFKG